LVIAIARADAMLLRSPPSHSWSHITIVIFLIKPVLARLDKLTTDDERHRRGLVA
jgi:hypothetical protein